MPSQAIRAIKDKDTRKPKQVADAMKQAVEVMPLARAVNLAKTGFSITNVEFHSNQQVLQKIREHLTGNSA